MDKSELKRAIADPPIQDLTRPLFGVGSLIRGVEFTVRKRSPPGTKPERVVFGSGE